MIGILGGTFDPPHWGHVKLAKNFIEILDLDELLWLPAGQPWQKSSRITPAETRYELTRAAKLDLKDILDNAHAKTHIGVSRIELDRQGPSYTIDTARELRSLYGASQPIVWLMGADTYHNLSTWNDWQKLPDYLHLAVASRKISPRADLAIADPNDPEVIRQMIEVFEKRITSNPIELGYTPHGKVFFDESFHVDLSSTALRDQLHDGVNPSSLKDSLSPKVLDLITRLGIYLPTTN